MESPRDLQSLFARANSGDAAAQYAFAAALSRLGRRDEAQRWLNSAAENGCGDAIYTLATRLLFKSENAEEAAAKLSKAKASGSTDAARLLGVMQALGLGVTQDEARSISDLLNLAKAGEASALREIACILALRDVGDAAISSLIEKAASVDPVAAAFALARAQEGRAVAGDPSAHAAVLRRFGYPRAAALTKDVKQNVAQSGVAIDWDAIKSDLSLTPHLSSPQQRLSSSPDVVIFRQAAPPEVCEYVIAHSASRLGPSLVYDPQEARMVRDPLRTSATASLSPIDLDLAMIALNRLMCAAAGCEEANGEFLSVLNYAPGQQYRPHFDCIPPGPDFDRSGQRAKTALLFLNDDYGGGETHFTEIDLKVRGRRGDILVFSNLDASGAVDRTARHAGLPVTSGAKWLASKWFRTKKFHF